MDENFEIESRKVEYYLFSSEYINLDKEEETEEIELEIIVSEKELIF